MDATVTVAAMGFASTVLGVWLSARWQRKGAREAQILEAQVRVYGECAAALYEYERATYSRARARLEGWPDEEREGLRQEAYRCEVKARSAIGQATYLSGTESLDQLFESVRQKVGSLNEVADRKELYRRHENIHDALRGVLRSVRSEMRH